MSDHVEISETIDASAEALYDLIADITRMGDWSPETTRCRWTGGATGPETGAKFTGSNKSSWRRWSTQCRVTEATPGKRFAFHVTFAKFPIADWSYDFVQGEGGTTTVTEAWTDRRQAWMIPLSKPVMGVKNRPSHNELGMRKTLDNLKRAAEKADAPS